MRGLGEWNWNEKENYWRRRWEEYKVDYKTDNSKCKW